MRAWTNERSLWFATRSLEFDLTHYSRAYPCWTTTLNSSPLTFYPRRPMSGTILVHPCEHLAVRDGSAWPPCPRGCLDLCEVEDQLLQELQAHPNQGTSGCVEGVWLDSTSVSSASRRRYGFACLKLDEALKGKWGEGLGIWPGCPDPCAECCKKFAGFWAGTPMGAPMNIPQWTGMPS